MKYEYNDGGRSKFDFKNKKSVGDCVVRSIAIATKTPYLIVWEDLFNLGKDIGFMPNDVRCYEVYLKSEYGLIKHKTPKINGKKIRLVDWSHNLALVHTTNHLTCVINDCVYDTNDPREWCVNNYFARKDTQYS